MKFEKMNIPEKDTDYREVARIMEVNIKCLKEDLTAHVDKEIERFFIETGIKEDPYL